MLPLLPVLLCTLLAAAEAPAAVPIEVVPTEATHRVALIQVDGPIDSRKAAYFERAMDQALSAKADIIVSRLTTDGGDLGAGLDMLATCARARTGTQGPAPRLVALVEGKAWSAGAMIAYGHQEVYLVPESHIGDIGVIMITAEGKIEYAPEKIESPVRAQLRTLAQNNGWNQAKLQKMTARNQELYRFTLNDGNQVFVLEDDLGRFQADHADLPPEGKVLILGQDRLISYTAQEAVEEGMATGVVVDLDSLWTTLGVDKADILDLTPTVSERTSWALAGLAPILAALAVIFIILELKTPGVGLWVTLAACSGLGFFVCQYYLEMASAIELILILIGLAAVVVELFFLPTGGILGFVGAALGVTGLLLAFMPDNLQFSFGSAGYADAMTSALIQSLMALVMVTVGIVWLIRSLPGSRAVARIAVTSEIAATSAGTQETNAALLVGRQVTVHSELRPSGFVVVDGEPLSATSEHGEFVVQGATVQIVDMRYGEAIVRPIGNQA